MIISTNAQLELLLNCHVQVVQEAAPSLPPGKFSQDFSDCISICLNKTVRILYNSWFGAIVILLNWSGW